MKFSLATFVLAFLGCSFARDQEWDHFVFTIEWPQSVCWQLEKTEQGQCRLPCQTNFWTLHGLWPSFSTTHTPCYCKNESKFNESLIASIENEMNINWPDLLPGNKNYSFWKHEWEKHGTCSMSMQELDTELKYFTKVLNLHQHFDLDRMLGSKGFIPSDEVSYKYSELAQAFQSVLGVKGLMFCYNVKKEVVQFLTQFEFCLDKSFNPIECPHHELKNSKTPQGNETPMSYSDQMNANKRLSQVFKMSIRNEVGISRRPKCTSSQRGNLGVGVSLQLVPCVDNKEIMYPVIRHQHSCI